MKAGAWTQTYGSRADLREALEEAGDRIKELEEQLEEQRAERQALREALEDSTELLRHTYDENDEGGIAAQIADNERALKS